MKNNQQHQKNLQILIIEDSPTIMTIHKMMVEFMGYEPDCAIDGAQAIKFFQDNDYDVILSDIGLPDIDGISLAERFRLSESIHGKKKTYIAAVTAFSVEELTEQCFLSDINEVLAKPLTNEKLEYVFQKAYQYLQSQCVTE